MIRLIQIALPLAIVVPLGMVNAQDRNSDAQLRAFNNFVHEHTTCAAYFAIGAQCIRSRGDKPSIELGDRLVQMSETAYSRGIEYGDALKMSRKTHTARLEMAISSMMGEMEKNCINISILLNKHALSCKKLMEQPDDALERIMAGKPLKD